MVLRLIKAFHVLGAVLFFGSILGHAITGLAANVQDSAQTQLVARQIIDVATWYLTLPGLALLVLTGIGLVVMRERPIRLMGPHLFLAALILVNAIFFLFPIAQAILGIANDLAAGTGSDSELRLLEGREAIFGAINILLCILATVVGVIKPGTGKEQS